MKGSVRRKHIIEVILRFIGNNWDMSIWLIMFETIKVITSNINWMFILVDSDSTNEVVHPHEVTIKVDSNDPVSDNTLGKVNTIEKKKYFPTTTAQPAMK
jgi:hypothetical protein